MFIQSSQNIEGVAASAFLRMPSGYNLEDVGPTYFPSLGINDGSLAIDVNTKIPYYVGNNYWREILFTKFAVSHAWINTGNKQTNPNTNFIGTLDDQAFLISAGTGVLTGPGATRYTIHGQIEPLGTGQCVFFGEGAGINTTINTGTGNSFIGYHCGQQNTIGLNNTASGSLSMKYCVTATNNTAYGYGALQGDGITSPTGNNNTVAGFKSMYSNTTGYDNVAIGYQSLYSNTTGYGNVTSGYQSLYSNTTGHGNVTSGYQSLFANTTGFHNIATGYQSLFANTTGNYNIASGYQALRSNISGTNNISLGYQSSQANISGTENIAIGTVALFSNTEGNYNITCGNASLSSNTTGDHNIALGFQSLRSNISGSNNIVLGFQSLYSSTTGYENIAIGTTALRTTTIGHHNIALGYGCLYNFTIGSGNIGIGEGAGTSYAGTENNCIFIGTTGTPSESGSDGHIEIGTEALHVRTLIQGIFNNSPPTEAALVEINAYGKLGTSATATRFMDNITNMGTSSSPIMAMRPVNFNYFSTPSEPTYGLVAEEVFTLMPSMVTYDIFGAPYTVRYQHLPILLLNETIRQQAQMDHTDVVLNIVSALLDLTVLIVEQHEIFLRIITGGVV